jgi:hypothetical protein
MKLIKKNLPQLVLPIFIFILPVISFAQTGGNSSTGGNAGCDPASGKICNPIPGITSINGLIKTLLEGALKIGIPLIALAIIYCGFLFVQARGNPEGITKAKDALLYTLIGAAILLGSWAIAQLISATVTGLSIAI